MKKSTKTLLLTYLAASAAGVLLHFLHQWFPNPIFALISPVRESVLEHVKLLYFHMLGAALFLGRGKGGLGRAPWLLSQIAVCAVMLGSGYLYHVVFRGEAMVVDLLLFFVPLALGFLLPRALWPLCEWPGTERWAWVLSSLLGALIVCFTFFPPEAALFADLSEGLRTFLTIPV